jgi:hypothetical protein
MNEEKTQIADGVASELNAELDVLRVAIKCGDCYVETLE